MNSETTNNDAARDAGHMHETVREEAERTKRPAGEIQFERSQGRPWKSINVMDAGTDTAAMKLPPKPESAPRVTRAGTLCNCGARMLAGVIAAGVLEETCEQGHKRRSPARGLQPLPEVVSIEACLAAAKELYPESGSKPFLLGKAAIMRRAINGFDADQRLSVTVEKI